MKSKANLVSTATAAQPLSIDFKNWSVGNGIALNDKDLAKTIWETFGIKYVPGFIDASVQSSISLIRVFKLAYELNGSEQLNNKFYGIEALQDIGPNKRILQYTGLRVGKKALKDDSYAAQFKRGHFIDAARQGSFARWINGSNAPNCELEITKDGVYIKTICTIFAGQHLYINYGNEYKALENSKQVFLNPDHGSKSPAQVYAQNNNHYTKLDSASVVHKQLCTLLNTYPKNIFIPTSFIDEKNSLPLNIKEVLLADEKGEILDKQPGIYSLMLACYLGDVERIKRFILDGSIFYQSDEGKTAIYYLIISPLTTEYQKAQILKKIKSCIPIKDLTWSFLLTDAKGERAIDLCFTKEYKFIIEDFLQLECYDEAKETIQEYKNKFKTFKSSSSSSENSSANKRKKTGEDSDSDEQQNNKRYKQDPELVAKIAALEKDLTDEREKHAKTLDEEERKWGDYIEELHYEREEDHLDEISELRKDSDNLKKLLELEKIEKEKVKTSNDDLKNEYSKLSIKVIEEKQAAAKLTSLIALQAEEIERLSRSNNFLKELSRYQFSLSDLAYEEANKKSYSSSSSSSFNAGTLFSATTAAASRSSSSTAAATVYPSPFKS